jgi:uncharacterized protein with GYD domain
MLANFTEQGIKSVKETTRRAEAFREKARKMEVTVKEIYWTLGKYDVISVLEAPDEATVTALSLSLAKLGNVRTQTLPAYSAPQMGAILGKVD